MTYKMITQDALQRFPQTFTIPAGAFVAEPGACDVADSALKTTLGMDADTPFREHRRRNGPIFFANPNPWRGLDVEI